MNLKLLLPSGLFADVREVMRIVLEAADGSFALLPRRLDCVAALVPGILTYQTEAGGEVFVAIDAGVMTKAGADVQVAVRRAIAGPNLAELRSTIQREFIMRNDDELQARAVMARLDAGLVSRLAGLQHAR